MRNGTTLALVIASSLVSAPALAQDWSGPYGGLHFGYAAGRDTVSEVNGPRTYYADTSGAVFGAQLGWQQQFDRFVAGVEVEGGHLGQSGDTTRSDAFGSVKASSKLGLYGSFTGRVGYAVTTDWLVYGRAGLTVAQLDGDVAQSCPDPSNCSLTPSSASTRNHSWGYVFGGGVEHALSAKWTGRIEYQYTDYRRELALPAGGAGPGWNHNSDLHAVKVGINRRF